jgi:hypothetical protein
MTPPLTFSKWTNAVNRASLRLWGITPEDGGWSEADLLHHYRPDWSPEEFARWYGEKYDLQPVTPWWKAKIHAFDGLEIQPCTVVGETAWGEIVEPCDPEDAHFWTVYGHYCPCGPMGGVDALEDFPTEAEPQAGDDALARPVSGPPLATG